MKKRWYLSTPVIAILFALWLFLIPPIIGIVLLVYKFKQERKNKQLFQETQTLYQDSLKKIQEMNDFIESLGLTRYDEVTNDINRIKADFESQKNILQKEIDDLVSNKETHRQALFDETKKEREAILQEAHNSVRNIKLNAEAQINSLNSQLVELNSNVATNLSRIAEQKAQLDSLIQNQRKQEKQLSSNENKLRRIKELYKSIEYCITNFFNYEPQIESLKLPEESFREAEILAPTFMTQLHCMSMKDLQKAYRENDKQIDELFNHYSTLYAVKNNIAIYNLMVIALRSELQNILANLRYEKKDIAIDRIKIVTSKYLDIAGSGNQYIVGTLTKFIGEIEPLFINAVEIEYNYYVKKEQVKQEQAAIREQMRQEAEERKALEAEKKKIEKEESKYASEITKLNEQLSSANKQETQLLEARIAELQAQLSTVATKKKEITALANGKAGNVYVISNLGSFGEHIFKIGMTRRLDPLERINELGSASVPFKFDVHCFIFSDDAVSLESKLHEVLNDKRVNKVNLRKEFFKTTIDELENLVYSIDPTAEFNRTMAAEEYRQSLSSDFIYTSEDINSDEEDE